MTITPGPYHNLQLINVSVGPNHFFKPYSRINIIECADPGGNSKNLPTNVDTCDGNTIQGNTILVQRNGSFSIHGYQLLRASQRLATGRVAGLAPRLQSEEYVRALYRPEPDQLPCPQGVLRPVLHFEIEQAFVNGAGSMPSSRFVWLVFVALGLAVLSEAAITRSAGASAPPALNVSAHGTLTNGQTISVSVGSNGYFTPHARVNILECADPGGLAANLPKDDSTCDGNTIQGSTVLVGSDGSFSDPSYPVYLLPSATLGEQGNAQPICDQTHYCVLFVGQNQNDFTVAKVSRPRF